MSQTLVLPNYGRNNIVNNAGTQLTAGIAPGVNSLPVQDVDDFSSGGYLLLGTKGAGTSELIKIGTISSPTAIPLVSNTQLPHNQYEPVYPLFGNQLRIYRAPDGGEGLQPADGLFGLLATVNIDFSEPQTSYTDNTGGGDYWYKFTYYNPNTGGETNLSGATAVRGSFTPSYCSLDEIRDEAGFNNSPFITDGKINLQRQAAQDEINGALNEFYDVPLQPPINDYLKRICIRLAAGYLRLGQYSSNQNPQVNGQSMVDDAQAQLTKLILKERELMTKNGKALDEAGAVGGINGYPNGPAAAGGGSPRLFRMRDIQGQPLTSDHNGYPVGNLYYGRKW